MPLQGALTHWGRVTNICVSKQSIIAFDNGLSPGRRQAIIGSNDGILLIRTLGTKFSEILSKILTFSFKKMWLKVSSAKWRPFCLGLNVLKAVILTSLNGPRDNKTGRAWRPLRSRLFSIAIHINYNEISFTDSPDLNLTPLAAFLRFLPSAALGKNVKKQQEVSDLNQD